VFFKIDESTPNFASTLLSKLVGYTELHGNMSMLKCIQLTTKIRMSYGTVGVVNLATFEVIVAYADYRFIDQ